MEIAELIGHLDETLFLIILDFEVASEALVLMRGVCHLFLSNTNVVRGIR
jgi:hypothetical protein